MNVSRTFLAVYIPLQLIVIFNGFVCYMDGTLFVSQFRQRGVTYCLPYAVHGAVIGDLLLISYLAARCAAEHHSEWSLPHWAIAASVATLITIPLHFMWAHGSIPACFSSDGSVHRAGWIHAVYMVITLTIMFLVYFDTKGILRREYVLVSALLLLHECILSQNAIYSWTTPSWWPAHMPLKERWQPFMSLLALGLPMAFRYRQIFG